MTLKTDLNSSLRRVFRHYDKEADGVELNEHAKRALSVDERHIMRLQMRDNETENRADKRLVPAKNGAKAGIFATRDKRSVEEKLRIAFGGKTAKRILQRERQAARERPDMVRVFVEPVGEERAELVRGVDFAVVPPPHGEPTLVLHDNCTNFEVVYADDFVPGLLRV